MTPTESRVWVLTDGKAGDEMPLVGVAEALKMPFAIRRVKPRAPFVWFMPYGPIDPRERPGREGSPLAPPFPDICLATGRRAIAYARHLKRVCGCLIVLFKDPRTSVGFADLVFVQEHDRLRGADVVVTLTGPNRITAEKLDRARAEAPEAIRRLAPPRLAVLVGGDTRRFSFTQADAARLLGGLAAAHETPASLMITTSRRTPEFLRSALRDMAAQANVLLWDGAGPNPYMDFLGNADGLVVTTDSTNMVGEAAATGRPVYLFRPERQGPQFDVLLDRLKSSGIAHAFPGPVDGPAYPPLNETSFIARRIREALEARS